MQDAWRTLLEAIVSLTMSDWSDMSDELAFPGILPKLQQSPPRRRQCHLLVNPVFHHRCHTGG